MDPTGKQYDNDLNVLRDVTLNQLHALEILEESPLHIVSSCVPTNKDDDDLMSSTNTWSTGSLAELATNQLHTNWKDLDWKAGQGN